MLIQVGPSSLERLPEIAYPTAQWSLITVDILDLGFQLR